MTKQQVIDILEYFRPSRDKYCLSPVDDYVDDMIDSCIDNIIEFVKREPDNEWIECRKKMPENGKNVLVSEIEREENANEEKEVIENKLKEIENNEQIYGNS